MASAPELPDPAYRPTDTPCRRLARLTGSSAFHVVSNGGNGLPKGPFGEYPFWVACWPITDRVPESLRSTAPDELPAYPNRSGRSWAERMAAKPAIERPATARPVGRAIVRR